MLMADVLQVLTPSILVQVLMCPPDGCMSSGCIGSRIIDKQPIACGVDTVNADVGTVFTLSFIVYNSVGQYASVQRVISVVSPCASGEFLCDSRCSTVDCKTQASVAGLPGAASSAIAAAPPKRVMLPSSTSSKPTWSDASAPPPARGASGIANNTLFQVYM